MNVLLVEIVSPGRYFAGWAFPFAKGLLAQHGVAVRWLRFAVPADVRLGGTGEEGVALPDADRAALLAAVSAMGTDRVLFSARPAPSLVTALDTARPGVRIGVLAQTGAAPAAAPGTAPDGAAVEQLVPSGGALLSWALPDAGTGPEGGADADTDLVSVETPDYGFEPANAAARAMAPFVFACAGAACTYRAPLTTSAFFAERTLPGLPERWGCAFCTVPLLDGSRQDGPRNAGTSRPSSDELLRRQLAAVASTHPPAASLGAERLGVRIDGSGTVARPARFAALVEGLGLPPTRFLVDYRADALVRLRDELADAVRVLGAAGHRLDVCLVGVESFSGKQLDRYHKGYGPEVNLRAVRALRALEAAFPAAFAFREHGGLSTILFDPWTTIGDVALNVAVARRFRLEKVCGKLLTSRLRLVEGLPLTAAARADGLLADSYDDPLLDTARRNLYSDELPWRFAEPRLETVNRLLTRLPHDDALRGDPLYDQLQGWVRERGGDVLGCAERICREATTGPSHLPPGALLARATQDFDAPPDGPTSAPSASAPPTESDAGGFAAGFDALLDVAAFRAGLKPVLKLEEPYSTVHIEAIERLLQARWPALVIQRRRRQWGGGAVQEVFAGHDADAVAEAVQLTDLVEDETDTERRRQAFQRIGEMLGYPPCCAAAFAAEPHVFRENNEWLIVKRRLEAHERGVDVDPLFHPVRTGYVPCRLDCAATRDFVTRLEATTTDSGVPAPERATWGDRPTLLMLERPGDLVVLDPQDDPGADFRYRVAAVRGDDPRRAALETGERLIVEPGLVRVLRGRTETAWFALDAFLWQADRVQHAEFWRECLREVEDPIPDPAPGQPLAAAEPQDEEPQDDRSRLRRSIRDTTVELLRILESNPKQVLRGWRAAGVKDRDECRGWGDLLVTLEKGDARLRLFIEPREGAEHAFVAEGHFAITHDAETRIDTLEKERVVVTLARALERYVAPRVFPSADRP